MCRVQYQACHLTIVVLQISTWPWGPLLVLQGMLVSWLLQAWGHLIIKVVCESQEMSGVFSGHFSTPSLHRAPGPETRSLALEPC